MLIVYNSFEGQFGDNPRAIFEALVARGDTHDHVWLASREHLRTFPEGVRTVPYGGPECRAALEASDLVVANTHTDVDWEKGSTRYLQTWHGTPLKRIHWDVLWAPAGRLERLQRDVDRWDLLVSPNRASTPLLRQAFRYDGDVLETGYPRNDILSSPGGARIRRRVRQELGIDDDTTAVLYTPTWRDDQVFPEGGKPFGVGLDVDALTAALGDSHCLLLRLHYMVSSRLPDSRNPRLRDVSSRPDVSELYLAADVLITDYSSTMFDFAVTGKPMLFHTYDLEDYASRLRGFYFDFAESAPGPLLDTTDQLVRALQNLGELAETYADRYALFRQRYCHLEDGGAAERVIARVPGLAS